MLDGLRFSGQWRSYQQRVLDEFESFATDGRIHVVAAPGSGKTVLGIELICRIGRRALILSPSLTVRNQWAARLVPMFLPDPPAADFLSFDLTRPAVLTSVTYQALYAAFSDTDSARFADLLAWAAENGPLTVVLDEAHHLRREWWRALDTLLAGLPDVRVVALTATPPYDAPAAEWQRYIAANGPVDVEIGIPELVRNGDLCPHQDHVLFSTPSEDLLAIMDQRRRAVADLTADLRADEVLANAIAGHAWLTEPDAHIENILERPELLSAMLVHLSAIGRALPSGPRRLLGVGWGEIPVQDGYWLEVLLNGLLYDFGGDSPLAGPYRKSLGERLHRLSFIEGGRVRLGETKLMVRMIAGDRAKLDSIATIARAEAAARDNGLRMVVLTDHIRADDLPRAPDSPFEPARIGAATIFETLRRMELQGQSIAVLTGTFAAIPKELGDAVARTGVSLGIDSDLSGTSPMSHCDSHVRLAGSGAALAPVFTELLRTGAISVLVGTQSLLGEGWDAPMVNCLVLASNSASFMLSNQMRGRAIRIDPERADKVSSIWHLATVAEELGESPLAVLRERLEWGGVGEGRTFPLDLDLLERRFAHFAGIGNGEMREISMGIERLGMSDHATMHDANAAALARAADHDGIANDWRRSLGEAPAIARTREVARARHSPRPLVWHNTLEALALSAATSGMAGGAHYLWDTAGSFNMPLIGVGLATAAAVATLPKATKALWLLTRNGSLERALRSVGDVILAQLPDNDSTGGAAPRVMVERDRKGARKVLFDGLSRSAERVALDALAQVLGPVRNPRYLLVRRSPLMPWAADFHAVPDALSRDKQAAMRFAAEWRRRVGPSDLIFTRNETGRRMLLQARRKSLAAGMQRRVDRRSEWR